MKNKNQNTAVVINKKLKRKLKKLNISHEEYIKNKQESRKDKKEEDIDVKRFFELASSNRKIINNKNIHQIRDSLKDVNKEFELNGNLTINGQIKKN